MKSLSNDDLAALAHEKAMAAKPGTRERRAWRQVCQALTEIYSQPAAKAVLYGLSIRELSLPFKCATSAEGEVVV